MPAISIYDTDGSRIDEGRDDQSERIGQFASHGGQLIVDVSGQTARVVVRFSARDSASDSPEQYYAAYEGELRGLHASLQERLEELGGLTLGIEGEKHSYELFVPGMTVEKLDETAPIDRAASLLTDRSGRAVPPVKVGTDGYQRATEIVQYVLDEGYADRVAVAEDVNGPELGGYEMVVEQGPYQGIELLPETEQRLRESEDSDSESGQESEATGPDEGQNGEDNEEETGLSTVLLAGLAGLVLLLVLAIIGTFLLGDIPFLTAGEYSILAVLGDAH